MKIQKFADFSKITESYDDDDDRRKYTFPIEVIFKSNKEKEEAKAAIKKGIYYGLDVKGICAPKDIKINFI